MLMLLNDINTRRTFPLCQTDLATNTMLILCPQCQWSLLFAKDLNIERNRKVMKKILEYSYIAQEYSEKILVSLVSLVNQHGLYKDHAVCKENNNRFSTDYDEVTKRCKNSHRV